MFVEVGHSMRVSRTRQHRTRAKWSWERRVRRARRHCSWTNHDELTVRRGVGLVAGGIVGMAVLFMVAQFLGGATPWRPSWMWFLFGIWAAFHFGIGGFVLYARWIVGQLQGLGEFAEVKMATHRWFGMDEAMVRLLYLGGEVISGVHVYGGDTSRRVGVALGGLTSTAVDGSRGLSNVEISDLLLTYQEHYNEVAVLVMAVGDQCIDTLKVRGALTRGISEMDQIMASAHGIQRCRSDEEIITLVDFATHSRMQGSAEEIVHEIEACVKRVYEHA